MKVKTKKIKSFEDLGIWQVAIDISLRIYRLSDEARFRDSVLKAQMRRTAIALSSQIAEGFERGSDEAFARFLFRAKLSAANLRSHLHLAEALGYMSEQATSKLKNDLQRLSKKLVSLITYLRKDS